jgi:amino acid adenylation domain-containing protein
MSERDHGIQDAYPLSILQTGLLYEDLATPPDAARPYVIQQIDRYAGRTDVRALAVAYDGLVRRHSILRTGFAWDADEPRQFVVSSASLPTTWLDWSGSVPEGRREQALAALVAQDRRTPFDMAQAPLARLTVITLADDEVVTLFSIHHILVDDWASAILEAEFDELYRAAVEGRAADLPEAPPFGDYIRWQLAERQALDDKKLSFWADYLADVKEAEPVGLAGGRSDAPFERAAALIDPGRRDGIEKFARSARVTLNTVVSAAWALVLSGLTGSDDVVFGFTAVSRPQAVAHAQSLVGSCISTLPLRLTIRPGQQVRGWLRGIQHDLISLWDDEALALVDTGALSRWESGARNLIESFLVVENVPRPREHVLPGVLKTRVDSIGWTGYPIAIAVELTDGLKLTVTLDGSRGDAAVAQVLADRLRHVLLQLTDPDVPVSELEVLGAAERDQLLAWGEGPQADLAGPGLARRFEDQARRAPDAVAIEDESGPVTYAQLNARANQLARLLRHHGAGPETFIAIAMERSASLLTAFLAVIKAGAAYVPVPAAYPLPLARQVLDDIRPVLLLTDQALAATTVVAGLTAAGLTAAGLTALTVDDPALPLPPDTANLSLPAHLDQAAYVMFTSGSTGTPKGVTITQANILALTQDACWRNGNHRRVLMHSPHSFDANTYEMWVPLLAGDTVLLMPPGPLDPARLHHALTTRNITAMVLTKALFDLMLTEIPAALAQLREIVTGGEEASPAAFRRAAELCPDVTVMHVYGPTETTTIATRYRARPGQVTGLGVPIGVPVGNTRVYVLDDALRLVPPGVTGELYIAGPRLARGYHHRPAGTAARFVPDPFGVPGARMYRTGDLARWNHRGLLEFGGRTDDQVKVRGFRIELGAIEAALTAHPAVTRAAAAVREDRPGDKRLVAYLVPAPGHDPDHAAIHRHLAAALPAFMLPAAYVTLPALPLTAHHKVDRKALPAPAASAGPASAGDLPGTATEEILAGLFAEILGLDAAPGTSQDFFALGGHSLLAMRLINRIRAVFSTDLTIRDLFDHPAVEPLARHLDTSTATRTPIQAAPRPGILPLSSAQRRLHFLNAFDGPNAVYHVPAALALTGELDAGALHAAVNDLITRHETLRTLFPDHDGEPRQHILAPADAAIPLPLTDTTDDALPARLRRDAAAPFALATDQPIRAHLYRLAPDRHVLLLVIHHIATDGWSMRPLTRDLATAYHARARQQAPRFAPLPLHYADYALWQATRAPGQAADLEFWTRELTGIPEETPLPLDSPRPATRTHHGAATEFTISPDTHAALHHLARSAHATLFITLHAAVATLLHHHGAGTDIPLGTPTAGRTDHTLDDLVGFFVNTLVLRTDLAGDPPFRELLARTRDADLAAYAHQDLPFDQLVEHLAPARTPARHPLFQVMLTLDQTTPDPPALHDLDTATLTIPADTAKFDLTISFQPHHHPDGTPAGITGTITYATDIFTPPTITALTTHLTRLLTHATRHPDTPISELEVLGAAERDQLLAWGEGPQADLAGPGLARRFEDQARRAPDAVAIEDESGPVTYAQLNARANQLARLLRHHGAGPETFIAIAMERSASLLTAFLAVIKAGAAYVPVPAAYPLPLARQVLDDIRPVLLLTDQALAATTVVAGLTAAGLTAAGLTALTVDDPALPLPPDTANLSLPAHLDQAAYVMFTSGSTGTPKGVTITQANILALTQDACWRNGNHRRVLMHSPHSFDANTYEMWVPLLAGDTVLLMPPGPLDPARLHHALTTRNITAMVLTKALFDLMLTEIPAALAQLREIVTGGEEASPAAFRRAAELCPDVTVMHVYGPTETTTIATRYRARPGQVTGLGVPIGVPVGNTRVYVLDDALRLVPPGVTGELYIAGPRLARGYHHRPAGTAARFVPDPFGVPGARMYRTGDLARWNHRGLLEFGGRTDDQVKVRGFRIELGAIEAALTAHPAVTRAAAAVREDRPGDKRLVAYLVPAPGHDPDHAAIHRHLAAALPAFMLPAAYVTLPALPLTAHHKVDRKALPAPAASAGPASAGDLPGTATEEILAGLFAEILGLDAAPGTSQDFFALGGHSLLAMRLINRIRAVFSTDLTIRDLFDHPAVEPLARHLDTSTATRTPIQAAPRPGILPLSSAQRRLHFLNAFDGPNAVYHVPAALALTGELDAGALHAAVNDLITRHETLRTLFPDHDGEPRQHILAPADAAIPLPLTDTTDDALPARLRRDAAAPFALATDQPIRAHLYRLAPDRHVLLLVIHHIATDGWSMRPLTRDLATAYHARARQQAPRFAPLPLHYADYALWQATRAPGQAADLEFWTRELTGIPEETPLPLDSPRPATRTHHGAATEFTISPDTHAALHHLARSAHATLFITLHAAVATLLHHHGAGTDIPLGTPTAGRTDHTLDDLVGFFVNTLVLRTDLAGDPPFRELLARTRDADLAAYAHQDLPFDQLVEHLAPARTPARHPLFQVMLTLDQTTPDPPALHDLDTATLTIPADTAKFDLTISFQPHHHPDGTPAGITGTITYATDIFTPPTITALTTHLTRLLTHATRHPDTPISELEGAAQ